MTRVRTEFPHVALFFSTAVKTHRMLLQGILRFVQLHTPWIVHIEEGREDESPLRKLGEWGCTGIVCGVADPSRALAAYAQRTATPMVILSDYFSVKRAKRSLIGEIHCDNAVVAKVAADYFLKNGAERLAYVGEIHDIGWSEERKKYFMQEVQRAGKKCVCFPSLSAEGKKDAAVGTRELGRWLKDLVKPVALLAANDMRARQVLDVCLLNGISIPDDVAILGVDNDETLCETAFPPISSILMDCEEAGFAVGKLLDDAMRERRFPVEPEIIPYKAKEVIVRESSGPTFFRDPILKRCKELISLNLAENFKVNNLADSLHISRRSLEMHVRAVAKQGVAEMIQRARLAHARILLKKTDMTLETIAEACGFFDASHLGAVFYKEFGMTPRTFREQGKEMLS